MAKWVRFINNQIIGFGQLNRDVITVYSGNMYESPEQTSEKLNINEVELTYPTEAKNFLGLWNNFYSRAKKEGWEIPPEPLYFSKVVSSYLAPNKNIKRPLHYDGPVYFEAELGIVIGKQCSHITEEESGNFIFGYTCVNDVTALEILGRDKSFPQWVRSKGFNSFCPFGPVIDTKVDLDNIVIRAILDNEIKQEYKVSDMVFSPHQLVSLLSSYMTLLPGDVIACGTASGSGAMLDGQVISIDIIGLASLENTMTG